MIKFRITQIFLIILTITIFCSLIVGIAWLFNSQPANLYYVWKKLGFLLALAFVFQLLFGAKIEFK